jgi:hypothetical protein
MPSTAWRRSTEPLSTIRSPAITGFQRFRGFGGNDTFDGGEGDDEVDYRRDSPVNGQGITIDLSATQPDGSVWFRAPTGDTDTLIGIEWIRGTRHADSITGTNAFNRLRGDSGDDTIAGLGGDDRLEGGDGSDSLDGGSGHDLMFGDMGDDTLAGGVGNDTFFGGAGNDSLSGGAGSDFFEGSAGNDTIDGGPRSSIPSTSSTTAMARRPASRWSSTRPSHPPDLSPMTEWAGRTSSPASTPSTAPGSRISSRAEPGTSGSSALGATTPSRAAAATARSTTGSRRGRSAGRQA